MPRNPNIPRADTKYLRQSDVEEPIKIGSKRWFEWLKKEETRSFAFEGRRGRFTARKERKKQWDYWYAYRWLGRTRKIYLGTSDSLTGEKLNQAATELLTTS